MCQIASSDSTISASEVSVPHTQSSASDSSVVNQGMGGKLSSTASSSQIIKHFERTAEEQDAQDYVDQLLLEDELSNVRITEQGSKEEPVSIGELLDQNSTTSVQHSVSIGSEAVIITKTGSQLISVSVSQTLVESCQDLLCGCCELIHMRCAKVVNVRAKVCVCVCVRVRVHSGLEIDINFPRQARCPNWHQLISC